jgi:hypothetical protein
MCEVRNMSILNGVDRSVAYCVAEQTTVTDWPTDRPTDWLIDRPTDRTTDWPIDWLTDLLLYW